jgi:NAD(P)-dependent dehydrogenase (short-subunit alcohol dehydrogenase family)
MEIRDIVALVTGANRGIGRAIVQQLLAQGAKHVYAAARTPAGFTEATNLTEVRLDVTKTPMIERAAARCADVNVLINNAGVLLGQALLGAPNRDAAEAEMCVNYFGTLHMCRAFAPVLAHNGGGAIVNVLSILARVNLPTVGSYSASKAAALSLTQGIRGELAVQGTLVIGVMPAFVDTAMASRVTLPKLPPQAVAEAILIALRDGIEDVYPGYAAEVAAQLERDGKAVERQFAKMVPSALLNV